MINPLGSDHLVMTDHLDTPPPTDNLSDHVTSATFSFLFKDQINKNKIVELMQIGRVNNLRIFALTETEDGHLDTVA